MLKIIRERLRQGSRTLDYPTVQPELPPLYRGRPEITGTPCGGCALCVEACPARALRVLSAARPGPAGETEGPALDMGRCTFCGRCAAICPEDKLRFGRDYRLAAFAREDLIVTGASGSGRTPAGPGAASGLFRRSLKLRQVSAGGCNACEADCNVLGTLVYDLGRFGIDFVASPRHADALAVTGPVSLNMRDALLAAWEALPEPRLVVAVGSCAVSGGLFHGSAACCGGVDACLPVDLFIPGCPPNPWSILDGLLALKTR